MNREAAMRRARLAAVRERERAHVADIEARAAAEGMAAHVWLNIQEAKAVREGVSDGVIRHCPRLGAEE